jgi:hypothetical protein
MIIYNRILALCVNTIYTQCIPIHCNTANTMYNVLIFKKNIGIAIKIDC